jgi:hypothetical protein
MEETGPKLGLSCESIHRQACCTWIELALGNRERWRIERWRTRRYDQQDLRVAWKDWKETRHDGPSDTLLYATFATFDSMACVL